jgi:hypothetical protein
MRLKSVAGLALLLGTSVVVVRGQQWTQAAENYIKLSEQQWAEASMKRDTATVERILADDFVGLDPLGSFFRKEEELASVSKNVGDYVLHQRQRCERSRLWRCRRGAGQRVLGKAKRRTGALCVDGYLDTPQRQMANRCRRRRQSARIREVGFAQALSKVCARSRPT